MEALLKSILAVGMLGVAMLFAILALLLLGPFALLIIIPMGLLGVGIFFAFLLVLVFGKIFTPRK